MRYPGGWNHAARLLFVMVVCMAWLFVSLFTLMTIGSKGGCSSRYYEKVAGICESQSFAGWSTLTWIVALSWETMVSYKEQQRSVVVDTEYALLGE